jgi:hypothetical protein
MMSMARTDHLVRRAPPVFDSITAKLTRVFVANGGVGIRLSSLPSTVIGGSYSIEPVPGGAASSLGNCLVGEISMSGIWTLQDGGDGFFGLVRAEAFLSEATTTHADGNGVTTVGSMSNARDRWILEQVGDGSVMIVNRATGGVLTRSSAGCAYSAQKKTAASQHWLVDSST